MKPGIVPVLVLILMESPTYSRIATEVIPLGNSGRRSCRHNTKLPTLEQIEIGREEKTMRMLTQIKSDADLLSEIPTFSSCSKMVLEAYVAEGVERIDLAERQTLNLASRPIGDTFVVRAGLALLKAGDGVTVTLEPGDFFGSETLYGHTLGSKVIAVSDEELWLSALRTWTGSSGRPLVSATLRTLNGRASSVRQCVVRFG